MSAGALSADTATATAPERPVKAVRKSLGRPLITAAVVALAVLWTIPTFGLLISSLRPARDVVNTGWWTFFGHPHPGHAYPDRHRGHGRVFAGLGSLQGQRRDLLHCVRVAGRPAADDPHSAAAPLHARCAHRQRADSAVAAEGHLLPGLDFAHDVRVAAGDLPAAQLHLAAAGRPDGGREDRRREPLQDLSYHRLAVVDARAGIVGHLPVSLGLERSAGGHHVCWRPKQSAATHWPARSVERAVRGTP